MKALRIDKEPAYQCQLVDIDEAQFEAELAPEGGCVGGRGLFDD